MIINQLKMSHSIDKAKYYKEEERLALHLKVIQISHLVIVPPKKILN